MANEFKVKKGLIVQGSGSVGDNTILDVQGNQGQLFSITDSLSGSLFSVSDISGIPILEVFSDDTVKIGTFGSEGIIVNGSNVTASANISASGTITANAFVGSGASLTSLPSQTDNNFTTTLKNKLDAIEASADVTDATNVTAAGALMDSEVTNLADVKAFDTTDYATSAQGTTADAALPKSGGAMTGAITTNSTFDGRDVATDGTKLDTIETNADVTDTTNVTAAGALMDSELTSIALIKGLTAAAISGSWQGQNFISASQTFLSTGQRSGNSVITGSLFLVGSSGHLTASANISASGTITANYFTGTLTAPTAPTSLALSIVDDTINVTFSASATAEISHYEIHASDNGGTYGLISTITPDDFAASMSIIDDTFVLSGTQAYRVFAVKNGVFSTALAGSISFSAGTLDVVNMVVVPTLNTFQIKWDPPSLGARFVTAYNVTKHEHAVQASLSEASATQIYSGLNTSFTYQVNGIDNNNFHQFWISTTVA
jgi:hypothetical protein